MIVVGSTPTDTQAQPQDDQSGDVIVAVDGRPVRSADQVVRDVSSRLPGETIRVTVVRGQTRKTLTACLGARPDAETNP